MKYEKIYLDMDGVLADFDQHFINLYGKHPQIFEQEKGTQEFWETVYETPNYFASMPKKAGCDELLAYCHKIARKVVILSSPSRTNLSLCIQQKRQWLDNNFYENLPAIFEKEKHKYAKKGRLLVDEINCIKFTESGGEAFLYSGIDEFLKSTQ